MALWQHMEQFRKEVGSERGARILGVSRRLFDYWRAPLTAEDRRDSRADTLRKAGERLVDFGKRATAAGRALLREADRREKEGPTNGRRRRTPKDEGREG